MKPLLGIHLVAGNGLVLKLASIKQTRSYNLVVDNINNIVDFYFLLCRGNANRKEHSHNCCNDSFHLDCVLIISNSAQSFQLKSRRLHVSSDRSW